MRVDVTIGLRLAISMNFDLLRCPSSSGLCALFALSLRCANMALSYICLCLALLTSCHYGPVHVALCRVGLAGRLTTVVMSDATHVSWTYNSHILTRAGRQAISGRAASYEGMQNHDAHVRTFTNFWLNYRLLLPSPERPRTRRDIDAISPFNVPCRHPRTVLPSRPAYVNLRGTLFCGLR